MWNFAQEIVNSYCFAPLPTLVLSFCLKIAILICKRCLVCIWISLMSSGFKYYFCAYIHITFVMNLFKYFAFLFGLLFWFLKYMSWLQILNGIALFGLCFINIFSKQQICFVFKVILKDQTFYFQQNPICKFFKDSYFLCLILKKKNLLPNVQPKNDFYDFWKKILL